MQTALIPIKENTSAKKNGKYESSGIYHLKAKDLIELITPSSGEKTYFKHVETGFVLSDSLGTVNQGELDGRYILKRL